MPFHALPETTLCERCDKCTKHVSGRPVLASARPLTVQSSEFQVSREEESVLTSVTVTIRAGRSHEHLCHTEPGHLGPPRGMSWGPTSRERPLPEQVNLRRGRCMPCNEDPLVRWWCSRLPSSHGDRSQVPVCLGLPPGKAWPSEYAFTVPRP